jgi:ABC-2 type transport system ATP-binding protein
MIQTKKLVKRYGALTAVDGIDLDIRRGEVYGFLGPNGAGKTSTMMMLLGVTRPTSGEIWLFGEKYSAERMDLRKRIGMVPEKHPRGMWPWMTAKDYLLFFADLFDVRNASTRIDALLEKVGLEGVGGKRIKEFSHGMMQKLSFVRALLPDPDILLLDEPISGLDPIGIKQVRDLILEENRGGRSIFISSHQLSEMEKICSRVAIINHGRLVAEDAMDSLLERIAPNKVIEVELEAAPVGVAEIVRSLHFVRGVTVVERILKIETAKGDDHRKDISKKLIDNGLLPLRIEEKAPSLEEAFITITGENVGNLAGRSSI